MINIISQNTQQNKLNTNFQNWYIQSYTLNNVKRILYQKKQSNQKRIIFQWI